MITTIITATTGAASSSKRQAKFSNWETIMTTSAGADLATTETAIIQYTTDNGATWENLKVDGLTKQLDANTNCLTIQGPLLYRVTKSTTAGAVGIAVVE